MTQFAKTLARAYPHLEWTFVNPNRAFALWDDRRVDTKFNGRFIAVTSSELDEFDADATEAQLDANLTDGVSL